MFAEKCDTCFKSRMNTGYKRKKLLQKIGKGVIIYNKMMEDQVVKKNRNLTSTRKGAIMRMKKIAAAMLAAALSCGGAMSSMAATWVQTGVVDWKYQKDDGSFMTDSWLLHTDGKWYYLGADGMMKKGWFQDKDQKWYFLNSNGAMQTGLINVDGKIYWMESNGELYIGDKLLPSGLTFTFGLNGCTNGSPYTSNKFYGNGNAVAVDNVTSGGGGGGTTSKGYTVPDTVKDKTNEISNDVKATLDDLTKTEAVTGITVGAVTAVSDKAAKVNVKVDVKPEAVDEEAVSEIKAAASDAVLTIVEKADEDQTVKAKLGGLERTFTKEELESNLDDLMDRWVTKEKLNSNDVAKSGSISVVIDGVTVTYNISL